MIGFLGIGSPDPYAPVAAFREGLSETGYVEGQNMAIEYRWAENHCDRLPVLAADLVGRQIDMILTVGDEPAHAQCVNALERCVLPTASHPDLIRLQEGVRVALSDKVDRRQISASAGERRITEAGRLVAVPEREWGTGNNAAAARSRRSKKCCAELVAVAGATDAEAG